MQVTFKRVEEKFFVPASDLKELIRITREELKLPKSKYDKEFTDVESVYLDSPDLFCYRTHFKLGEDRFKLRFRNYAPDGNKLDTSFVELKSKSGGWDSKNRFIYPHTNEVPEEFDLSLALKNIDPNAEESVTRSVNMINSILNSHEMVPTCRVTYRRKSFENDKLRITIDKNVKFKILRPIDQFVKEDIMSRPAWLFAEYMKNYYDDNDFLIVEVKNQGTDEIPKLLTDFLEDRRVHFSKYVYSITSSIINENRLG